MMNLPCYQVFKMFEYCFYIGTAVYHYSNNEVNPHETVIAKASVIQVFTFFMAV